MPSFRQPLIGREVLFHHQFFSILSGAIFHRNHGEDVAVIWQAQAFLSTIWDGMSLEMIETNSRRMIDVTLEFVEPDIEEWWRKGLAKFTERYAERPRYSWQR